MQNIAKSKICSLFFTTPLVLGAGTSNFLLQHDNNNQDQYHY